MSGRWRHGQTAAEARQALDPPQRALLISAAWLHVIGYPAKTTSVTGALVCK
jgi:hypothetical protein